jgi:hypothetical protein
LRSDFEERGTIMKIVVLKKATSTRKPPQNFCPWMVDAPDERK